jgi:aryl-alcohol dehydrogenase-like predicted oxidoreductase
VAAIQMEWSLVSRSIEDKIVPVCKVWTAAAAPCQPKFGTGTESAVLTRTEPCAWNLCADALQQELGIPIVAYSPLSRNLLTDQPGANTEGDNFRAQCPRFQE